MFSTKRNGSIGPRCWKRAVFVKLLVLLASIVVTPTSAYAGSALLSWSAPTQNSDGTPLTDLAGYRLHSGCSQSGQYERPPVTVGLVTSHTLTGLSDVGTCYFAATALDTSGGESAFSNQAQKVMGALVAPDAPTVPPAITWTSMTTLHDTALGSNDTSTTTLSTADALAVTAGDLVVVGVKYEGGIDSGATVDTGAATPTFSVGRANVAHTGNSDLSGGVWYWTATATGTVNPRFVSASRPYRIIKAYSFTPAGGTTLELGNTNVAHQTGTTSISAGGANSTAAGASAVFYQLYSSRNIVTPGAGWTEAAEFNAQSAQLSLYRLPTGAGTITGDTAIDNGADVISQIVTFNEAAGGGTILPQMMQNQ